MEFLDINLTTRLAFAQCYSHAVPSTGGFYRKTHSTLDLKSKQKICETRKLESIHEMNLIERINEDRKPKNLN
jgi:hypothetical protein